MKTHAEKFTSSLTFINHFLQNAKYQLDKLELENKSNPRILSAKRNSLLTIEKFIYDSQRYIKDLELRNLESNGLKKVNGKKAKYWLGNYDINEPGQREAARFESIHRTKNKWPELF